MEHTQGKLEVQGTNAVSNNVSINSGKILIAHIWLPVSYEDKDKDKDYNLLNREALANAHRLVKCWNGWDELMKLNKLYKEYLNYAQHDENCDQAPIDSVDDCDCGLNELVSKIITAEKALILTESKEVKE